uniref:CAP-Gly domain-containing protein n=1 Tax=Panagrellus redivivus TaxID=6233 RepID=A0A7E4V789_PANRE
MSAEPPPPPPQTGQNGFFSKSVDRERPPSPHAAASSTSRNLYSSTSAIAALATTTSKANTIHTSLSTPSMYASFPSTSNTNYFITPAIGRHKFTPQNQTQSGSGYSGGGGGNGGIQGPKKSILKRSTGFVPPDTEKVAFESSIPRYTGVRSTTSPGKVILESAGRSGIPRVGFSEENTVAIFGDTSDDNTTENESEKLAIASSANSRIPMAIAPVFQNPSALPPVAPVNQKQTSILYSEDEDTDSPSQPAADSHEGTDFEDDTVTEDLENIVDQLRSRENPPLPSQNANSNGNAVNTDDGEVSASSNASSLVTSKWWFGKDMRYVTHCDKKGCNHKNHPPGPPQSGSYLTPTQQKAKEVGRLKKDLHAAREQVAEKERHLCELRDRVKEIEQIMDQNSALKEHTRLMQRQKELQDGHKAEKVALLEKHEVRVRQLIQEAVDARAEANRKAEQLENFYKLRRENYVDSEMMTDPMVPPPQHKQSMAGPPKPPRSMASSPAPGDPVVGEAEAGEGSNAQAVLTQETINQMQAYQNEAFSWRTKAAQLELVVKDQLSKAALTEANLLRDVDAMQAELDKLRDYCNRLEASALTTEPPSAADASGATTPGQLTRVSSAAAIVALNSECKSPACAERTRMLNDDVAQLREALDDRTSHIHELEEAVMALRTSGEEMIHDMNELKSQSHKLGTLAEERNAECQAAQLVLARLQAEKAQLHQALTFMEERVLVYRNTILDNNLVVVDENEADWARGFSDPRFRVRVSAAAQTDLTSDALTSSERDFVDLREKLREVHAEFSSKHKTLHEKFGEIEESLTTKSKLVEALSKQLEAAHRDVQHSQQLRQQERETYQARIDKLAKLSERIPFLEAEHERIRNEKLSLERRFNEIKTEYEDGLEATLDGTLKKYKEQATYWQERIDSLEQAKNAARIENERLKKEYDTLRMRDALNRADLEVRLTSSIDHVSTLNSQLNVPRRDAQCDARPKVMSKYVSCKPNTREKETFIEKGDLFDETEERLRLVQAELSVARRQVQVLQGKLFEQSGDTPRPSPFMNDGDSLGTGSTPTRTLSPARNSFGRIMPLRTASARTAPSLLSPSLDEADEAQEALISDLRENLAQLEDRNSELNCRVRQAEADNAELRAAERARIQQLVLEFDNVRKELDEEIQRYETERRQMKERIALLEARQIQHDKLRAQVRQWDRLQKLTGYDSESVAEDSEVDRAVTRVLLANAVDTANAETTPVGELQRSASFPTLLVSPTDSESEPQVDTDDLAKLKVKVERNIRRTAAQLSPKPTIKADDPPQQNFKHFSTDLAQVHEELEKILATLGEPPRTRPPVRPEVIEAEKNVQLVAELQGLQANYDEAARELEMYRAEAAAAVRNHTSDPRLPRSNSVENIIQATVTPSELQRWKEKAGTTFREVNRLRRDCKSAESERRELRTQVAILKGEIELAKAQAQLSKEKADALAQHRRGSINKPRTGSMSPTPTDNDHQNGLEAANKILSEPNLAQTPVISVNATPTPRKSITPADKTSIVQEALQKQCTFLKERVTHLETQLAKRDVAATREKLVKQPFSLSAEALPIIQTASAEQSQKIELLKQQVALYEKKIREIEEDRQQMYLVMFKKGQQAARHDIDEDKMIDQMTEDRIVLRFLHDAFYYYLLNRGNTREHLNAIMTMLNFTSVQKDEVCKRRGNSH